MRRRRPSRCRGRATPLRCSDPLAQKRTSGGRSGARPSRRAEPLNNERRAVPSTITTEPCAISGSKIATIGHRASADYLDGRRRVPLQQPLRSTRTRLGRGGRARGVSIVVTVETERNERIDELVDEDGHLGRLVAELMPPALLGGIDPYGNAMFNWRQLPSLRAELESQLARPEHAPGEHAFLRRVAALAQLAEATGA